jgi:Zn-dependent metalloprotease
MQNSLLRAGRVLGRADVMGVGPEDQPQRTIYDAQSRETLPGIVRRNEGDGPTNDAATDEAYDGLGDTWSLYADILDRNSIDDEGLPLLATVHYGEDYDNAFWDGQRMVFGDGDGSLFLRFTRSLDVIGHELSHGVVEDEAGLVYLAQPGALNESFADVFGSLVKQYKLGQKPDEADWLIGAELLGPDVQGKSLRSMKEPGTAFDDDVLGKDPQPGHMRDFVNTTRDNGGVHINSGIPNRAFYLAASNIGGFAWEKAGRIWYDAIRDPKIRPTARFRTFARATVRAAQHAFPDEAAAVTEAWREVGLNI